MSSSSSSSAFLSSSVAKLPVHPPWHAHARILCVYYKMFILIEITLGARLAKRSGWCGPLPLVWCALCAKRHRVQWDKTDTLLHDEDSLADGVSSKSPRMCVYVTRCELRLKQYAITMRFCRWPSHSTISCSSGSRGTPSHIYNQQPEYMCRSPHRDTDPLPRCETLLMTGKNDTAHIRTQRISHFAESAALECSRSGSCVSKVHRPFQIPQGALHPQIHTTHKHTHAYTSTHT